jgi:hypothetical protein
MGHPTTNNQLTKKETASKPAPEVKVQPWRKFGALVKTAESSSDDDIAFEYPESLLRLRCEADDKSLGG